MLGVTHSTTLLNVYFAFRIGLGLLLLMLFVGGIGGNVLGVLSPRLFLWTDIAWIMLATLSLIAFPAKKLTHSLHRITSFLVSDVVAILLLIHASGGVDSGFGYLLLVIVAISSIFMHKKTAILFAAMVSLLMMAQTLYLVESTNLGSKTIFSAGILGILLFFTAYTFQLLTQKIQTSTQEAVAQTEYAEHLQRLAQAIITRMRTGIIVLDTQDKIELMNTAAQQLLNISSDKPYRDLPLSALPQVEAFLHPHNNPNAVTKIQRMESGQDVRFSRAQIDLGNNTRNVIFLEDHRAIAQQAQQLKLASLGRLTASIAHEIRNPLGAISHAAQLLSESDTLSGTDKRLTEIIYQHSNRVNQIVENTLVLSRRKEPQVVQLELHQWLPHFVEEYLSCKNANIRLELASDPLPVRIDTTNLQQILVNLFDNGLRYSQSHTGSAELLVRASINPANDSVNLEVIDYGPGIEDARIAQIFEPFYTTEELGTGLGLYICKELCEINQASLHYKPTAKGESCFRINFPHHLRMF